MGKLKLWIAFPYLLSTITVVLSHLTTSSENLPLEGRDNSGSSQEDDLFSSGYVLPNQIFNDGKPFYVGKDPISGQLDFSAKKPAGIEPAANEVFDPKEKIVLSSSSPNIHDFLNLPVKYSSSKFVYPLVSSSYANLKYQGNNKNYITNKKTQSVMSSSPAVTPTPEIPASPNYYPIQKVNVTKLQAVSTPTTKRTTTTTTTSTTTPSPPRYTTTNRPSIVSSTPSYISRTSTTRKKFVPTKKYASTSTTQSTPSVTTEKTIKFPSSAEPEPSTSTASTTKVSSTTIATTHKPPIPLSTSIFPKAPIAATTTALPYRQQPDTSVPGFSPISSSTHMPILEPGDIYQAIGNKKEGQNDERDTMTLADIFNTLADEEADSYDVKQHNQGIDAQGNLIRPISPAQPAPFAMHSVLPSALPSSSKLESNRVTSSATPAPIPSQGQKYDSDKPARNSQENFRDEYVQYQVQQPNVLQYRPIPGAINNVVISPGQNSATFVLGSQQTVGTNSFGSVEKEPLFAKEPPVQYGTVISEDISSGMARPQPKPQVGNFPAPSFSPNLQQRPSLGFSNFHQNGNFSHSPTGNSNLEPGFNGLNAVGSFHQAPPAPSSFQQLPNVNFKNPHTYPHPSHGLHGNIHQETVQNSPPPQASFQHGLRPIESFQNIPASPQSAAFHKKMPETNPMPPTNFQQTIPMSGEQETQELLVSSNIRFPANDDQSVESQRIPSPTPNVPTTVNGHAQPQSLQQIQHTNQVVFPKNEENNGNDGSKPSSVSNQQQLNEVQYQGGDIQIQKHEVLTLNQHQLKQKVSFPQQQNTIPPAQHMEPPRFISRPGGDHQGSSNRPHHGGSPLPLSGPHTPSYQYNEFTRKPISGMNRPNPDRALPNILPQFRPNAKISGGHGPAFNQEPGNIRVGSHPYVKRPSTSPQFAHRRQPMVTHRYPGNRISDYPAGPPPPPQSEGNRRVYRLPPHNSQQQQFVDRMHVRRQQPVRPADSYAIERHAQHAQTLSHTQIPHEHQQPLYVPDKLAALEEDDLVINDPPQPVTPAKDRKDEEEAKLEPVVTLQMLQSQKKTSEETQSNNNSDETKGPNKNQLTNFEKVGPSQGLYVVYPMKPNIGESDINESAETKEPLPAIAHYDTATANDYQNTPFSVVRDPQEEPILMVKNKKQPPPQPQRHQPQQQHLPAAPKDKFPYPIEKPDPSYAEMTELRNVDRYDRSPNVVIAPRIINGGYPPFTGTEAAIAVAYTPTEPNRYRGGPGLYQNGANKFSNINLASTVIHEIRDSQTEDGLNQDFDTRGQNFEKDFMAPFYPSVSLGLATNAPSNGWNVYNGVASTESSLYEKNNINRADVAPESQAGPSDTAVTMTAETTTTKTFGLDSFQPELQGGFKPIYPPGYKINDDEDSNHSHNNMPIALASRMEIAPSPVTSTTATVEASAQESESQTHSPSAAALTASTTERLPTEPANPILRKKSNFETSLEALLFGDDEDFEEETADTKYDEKKTSR